MMTKMLKFDTSGKELQVGFGSVESVAGALEAALEKTDYFAGDRFTAADVYLGSQLGWATQWGAMEVRPAIAAYLERITARPAAVRAKEIDDKLVPAPAAS